MAAFALSFSIRKELRKETYWRYCLCFKYLVSSPNTRLCKQVNYHESIRLSCKICWILLSIKKLKQEVDDELSVFVDEHSPRGLSITGNIKTYQCHMIKTQWCYYLQWRRALLLSRSCFYCLNLIIVAPL